MAETCLTDKAVLPWNDRPDLELARGDVSHHCGYTKCCWIIYTVDFMLGNIVSTSFLKYISHCTTRLRKKEVGGRRKSSLNSMEFMTKYQSGGTLLHSLRLGHTWQLANLGAIVKNIHPSLSLHLWFLIARVLQEHILLIWYNLCAFPQDPLADKYSDFSAHIMTGFAWFTGQEIPH